MYTEIGGNETQPIVITTFIIVQLNYIRDEMKQWIIQLWNEQYLSNSFALSLFTKFISLLYFWTPPLSLNIRGWDNNFLKFISML